MELINKRIWIEQNLASTSVTEKLKNIMKTDSGYSNSTVDGLLNQFVMKKSSIGHCWQQELKH